MREDAMQRRFPLAEGSLHSTSRLLKCEESHATSVEAQRLKSHQAGALPRKVGLQTAARNGQKVQRLALIELCWWVHV